MSWSDGTGMLLVGLESGRLVKHKSCGERLSCLIHICLLLSDILKTVASHAVIVVLSMSTWSYTLLECFVASYVGPSLPLLIITYGSVMALLPLRLLPLTLLRLLLMLIHHTLA